METFGQYIRKLRNGAGYTLTQLAAKLDMDSANLSKIENGKRIFDEKKLELLAKIFSLNQTDLKNEYYAEKFVLSIIGNNVSPKSLKIAEQKIKYIKNKKN